MTIETATTTTSSDPHAAAAAHPRESSGAVRWFLLTGRIALAAVFLYAVFAKLDYPPGNFATFRWSNWKLAIEIFAISVNGYGVLPQWAVTPVAYAVPLLETLLGIALLAGVGLRWSSTVAGALLLFFFSIMLRAYFLGMSIDCGCFGPGDTLSAKTLARDGALLALALALCVLSFRQARRKSRNHR